MTDSGWSNFSGLIRKGIQKTVKVKTKTRELETTLDHEFYTEGMKRTPANQLTGSDKLIVADGIEDVIDVTETRTEKYVYDLHNVENNSRFYANGILVSNCKFLIFDETLINSINLANLEGIDPYMKMGQARWYKKINPRSTYLVSLDPSLGTGGDYAAIQIVELPCLEQVCEWHHNMTPIQAQVRILRDLLRKIEEECQSQGLTSSIYYSVENNTVGESALVAINELGEETFPGLFLSEPIKKGHVRRFRKGFNTTHAAKISTCAKLKQLVETKKLKINSKTLISELKTFVATGITFKAKTGQHDDLVASMLLAIRMLMLLQDWDPAIYDKIREEVHEDYDMPMPIYISGFN